MDERKRNQGNENVSILHGFEAFEAALANLFSFVFELQDTLVDIMVNPHTDALEAIESNSEFDLTEKECSDLFALRGLLTCELLAHSLQMRHRVDFGVSR